MSNYKEILEYIDPTALSYQEWCSVGMALHQEGESWELWDEWSQRDSRRYHEGECEKKWSSFGNSSTIVTGGTIIHMAEENGYIPWSSQLLDWDDTIEYDWDDNQVVTDLGKLDSHDFNPEELGEFDPVNELKTYINTLFKDNDIIAYNLKSFKDEDNKYKPSGMGVYGRTAKEILKALDKHKDIEKAIGDYDEAAGGWIRFNPMDGHGVNNKNVAEYKYALVESDTLSLGEQIAIMEEMQLPIAVMLYSGGKSIHAIVRINAKDSKEYSERVDYLYKACEKNQLKIDRQNKNPSRLSRMPGLIRDGKQQRIIKTNIGKSSYDEWLDWIDGISDDLPEFEDFLEEYKKGLPELAPEMIEGILRQGHKMLMTGPSKAGKSFALIQLCIALSTGGLWMGHKCRKGRVLYINFELDAASCKNRFYDVYSKLGIAPSGGISIWNLRGQTVPLNQLVPKIIRRTKGGNYEAIIMDPIYKTLTGDENSAKDMSDFCGFIDRMARETGASIIYCHHHSKGSQSGKSSMDRGSGSGVFARDPDAIIDMVQINPTDCDLSVDEGVTAWRISYTLREFMTPRSKEVLFEYPVHKITDQLADAGEMYGADAKTRRDRGNKAIQKRKEQNIQELHEWVDNILRSTLKPPTLTELKDQFDKSESTLKRWISDSNSGLYIENGYVLLKQSDSNVYTNE